ncbi:hypothetical protein DFP73DRAFT_567103 [Morchella snyderi]|nr:hypothetical protein DFP73DRAFT_567103 [Morchella snyderi]
MNGCHHPWYYVLPFLRLFLSAPLLRALGQESWPDAERKKKKHAGAGDNFFTTKPFMNLEASAVRPWDGGRWKGAKVERVDMGIPP